MASHSYSIGPGEINFDSILPAIKKLKVVLIAVIVLQIFSSGIFAQQAATVVSQKTKELFQSIRSGSDTELEKQLAGGASVNDSLDGYSAMMAATICGTAQQMKLLIDHGANVNFVAQNGITALWLAVPDWDKTTLLLNHGAEVRHTIDGYSILIKPAAMPGTLKLLNLLMEHGADPKKSGPDNYLLFNAASSGDTAILGTLIRRGLNINDSTSTGDYPINAALFYRNFPSLKMIVDNGANVNVTSRAFLLPALDGFTPLMNAAVYNDKKSFYYLLEHGADPNQKNKNGHTALMLLQQAEEDDPAMTMALINHGAVPTTKTPAGNDALHFAMQKGNTQSVELLKKYINK